MTSLARLEAHLAKREWVQLHREAARLLMLEALSSQQKGRIYRAWGRAKAGLNEPYAAIDLLCKAIPYSLKAKDWDCLGYARADLGALYIMIGDIQAGIEALNAYLLDYERYSEATNLYGKVRFNLALAHKHLRDYPATIQQYEAAIDWFTVRGHTLEKAMVHQNLAWLYCLLQRPEDARPHLEVADTFRETLPPSFDAEQICCWAHYYWTTGQVGDAIDAVQEILLSRRPGIDAHHTGQAAVIAGEIAVLLDQEIRAKQLLGVAINAVIEAEDPPLATQCGALKAAINHKWGSQEAAN